MKYVYKSCPLGLPAKNLFPFLFYNCLLFKPKTLPEKFTTFQRISVHYDRKKHSFIFNTTPQKAKQHTVSILYQHKFFNIL